jgi:1-acyl-sn-glycerol-3-phosphate acyltransferase
VRADDITRAVLARTDVAKYLGDATPGGDARERVEAYLDELRTTQRYRFYRALQHPLYPILRKVRRIAEHLEYPREATSRGRVLYVSNHKSHLDYLVEPLVLDDNGIRPPVVAAGINLFGGPLGLLHRHVTGAIPIRRNSKDPVYLATLRAYIAELLNRRDLLYYAEGGRSYTGDFKAPKTGLLQAALQADRAALSIVPMAVAYDLVLEERIISREATRRRRRPFSQEVAEMIRHAVGYRSRAFVTFGPPIPMGDYDPDSRRDLVALTHRVHDAVGRLHKVLPTALVATAMRPNTSTADLVSRVDELLAVLRAEGANLAVTTARQAVNEGLALLEERAIVVPAANRVRVRDRVALRYYARTIQHLLSAARTTH